MAKTIDFDMLKRSPKNCASYTFSQLFSLMGTTGTAIGKCLALCWKLSRAIWIVKRTFPHLSEKERILAFHVWSREVLSVLRVDIQQVGQASFDAGTMPSALIAANHVSWLDILVIGALWPSTFVAKSEVRKWPVFGGLADKCCVIFVKRNSIHSTKRMVEDVAARLSTQISVACFPEGTSTDGSSALPFHSNVFEAAIVSAKPVVPLAICYVEPGFSKPCTDVAFVGNMSLAGSIWRVLLRRDIVAKVFVKDIISPSGHNRRSLSKSTQQSVAEALCPCND